MERLSTMTDLNDMGLTDEVAQECIELIQDISGVVLTKDQLAAVFHDDEDLVDEIVDWGTEDTETGGRLASAFAKHVLDRSWPLYGEKADLDAFVGDLRAAALAKGYKVEQPA